MDDFYKQLILLFIAVMTGGGVTHLVKESSCQSWIGGYRVRFRMKSVDTGQDLDGDGKNDVEQKFELGLTKLERPPPPGYEVGKDDDDDRQNDTDK